ncbi:MAG: FMN-binding glutamate synthase family protein, partial [Novosphingobium sp.]|nr:FMN-binding glutamate synthase family protein [Novosphingobium sp.]
MLDTFKRSILVFALAALFALAIWKDWWWLAVPSGGLVLLGLYDWFQRGWTVTRNFPIAGHIRQLAYQLRPYLRAYIVEDDLGGTPYSYEARHLVHARARGSSDTHPFGTERDVEAADYHWITHSVSPCDTPDEDPRVMVGNSQTKQPYSASIMNISAMSFGALSANAVRALNLGAKLGGFYHDTGEGGFSRYHQENGGDVVWELGSGYFGARTGDGNFDPEKFRDKAAHDQIKMTEIKLSQGAKPGHGGLLP